MFSRKGFSSRSIDSRLVCLNCFDCSPRISVASALNCSRSVCSSCSRRAFSASRSSALRARSAAISASDAAFAADSSRSKAMRASVCRSMRSSASRSAVSAAFFSSARRSVSRRAACHAAPRAAASAASRTIVRIIAVFIRTKVAISPEFRQEKAGLTSLGSPRRLVRFADALGPAMRKQIWHCARLFISLHIQPVIRSAYDRIDGNP